MNALNRFKRDVLDPARKKQKIIQVLLNKTKIMLQTSHTLIDVVASNAAAAAAEEHADDDDDDDIIAAADAEEEENDAILSHLRHTNDNENNEPQPQQRPSNRQPQQLTNQFTLSIDDKERRTRIESLGNVFPQASDDETVRQLYTEADEAMKSGCMLVCAVCSRLTRVIDLVHVDAKAPMLAVLKPKQGHKIHSDVINYYDLKKRLDVPTFPGIMLDDKGVENNNNIRVCVDCHKEMSAVPPRVPLLSLANGRARGVLPEQFRDVTEKEWQAVSLVRARASIYRIYNTARTQMRGRIYYFQSTPLDVSTTTHQQQQSLPRPLAEERSIAFVSFCGPGTLNDDDKTRLLSRYRVRTAVIHSLLLFLKANNIG